MEEMGPFIKILTDSNVLISTASAKILASEFKTSIWQFILPLFASIAAAIAAFMSYFSSRRLANLSHTLFLNDLNREYSDLSARLFDEFNPNFESGISNKNKKGMCNFLQKICNYYYDKTISKEELLKYSADLFNDPFVKYADEENKKNRTLGSYVRWLCEKNIIQR